MPATPREATPRAAKPRATTPRDGAGLPKLLPRGSVKSVSPTTSRNMSGQFEHKGSVVWGDTGDGGRARLSSADGDSPYAQESEAWRGSGKPGGTLISAEPMTLDHLVAAHGGSGGPPENTSKSRAAQLSRYTSESEKRDTFKKDSSMMSGRKRPMALDMNTIDNRPPGAIATPTPKTAGGDRKMEQMFENALFPLKSPPRLNNSNPNSPEAKAAEEVDRFSKELDAAGAQYLNMEIVPIHPDGTPMKTRQEVMPGAIGGETKKQAVPGGYARGKRPSQPFDALPLPESEEGLIAMLRQPVPQGKVLFCFLRRHKKGGLKNKLFPRFELIYDGDGDGFADDEEGNASFLMAAKKRKGKTSPNYLISRDLTRTKKKLSETVMGKVREHKANEYRLFDVGMNPKKVSKQSSNKSTGSDKSDESEQIRCELAACVFGKHGKQPRTLSVTVPRVGETVVDGQEEGGLLDLIKGGVNCKLTEEQVLQLVLKRPIFDEKHKCWRQDFGGRVKMASVKNFQLAETPTSTVVLQFGKVTNERFNMDVRWPLTPLQALGISLMAMDCRLGID